MRIEQKYLSKQTYLATWVHANIRLYSLLAPKNGKPLTEEKCYFFNLIPKS